ncbi:uncharacterized protein LOC124151217 isoform X1 [Haliotis rufescens]|uniref:uncharacterized protein LOC124151217 isoform X1 n=1 Tax=Haliotis rufescens TaxID=6454 RepID=UPI00201EC71E|nr:uncharacterized protein LOC124151217 isoform X1 [Haliotis rufescens]
MSFQSRRDTSGVPCFRKMNKPRDNVLIIHRAVGRARDKRSMSAAEAAILEQMIPLKPRLTGRRKSVPPETVRPTQHGKHESRERWRPTLEPVKVLVHPRKRFKRYIRLALICIRLCNTSYQSVKESGDEFLSVIQVSQDYATIDRDGLFFDTNDFKADTQDRVPQEAKRILQMKPEERSLRDVQYLVIVLSNIPAFAEYPRRMQHKLCAVGWYEAYEPKRAIVREGHPPHSFYFLLSGTVLVTAFENGVARTLVSLRTGMSFGELAVITRSRRQATVSTHTPTELLCISAKDFEDIFMAGGMQNLNDPDHISFIRSVGFLRHWPVEILSEYHQACMFHYFNRGQVLVRDSNNSDWIYIVKSGSLSVLKKLQAAQPDVRRHGNEPAADAEESDHVGRSLGSWDRRLRKRRRKHSQRMSMSEPEVYRSQYEMERQLEQTLPGFHNNQDRLGLIDYDAVIREHRSRLIQRPSEATLLPKIEVAEKSERRPGRRKSVTERPLHLPPIHNKDGDVDDTGRSPKTEIRPVSKTAKGVYLAPSPIRSRHHVGEDGRTLPEVSDTQRGQTREERVSEDLAKMQIEYRRKIMEREGRKTIAEELDSKGRRDFVFTEADLNPMFILVQVLERGQYFGVSNTIYPEQPSLSLVSNGAECIVLSKKLFLERSSEAGMRHVRHTECPFPDEVELQKNLKDYVNWEAHRAKIYRRLVRQKQKHHAKKKQFLPQYVGQYSFRTGPL